MLFKLVARMLISSGVVMLLVMIAGLVVGVTYPHKLDLQSIDLTGVASSIGLLTTVLVGFYYLTTGKFHRAFQSEVRNRRKRSS